MALKGIKKEGFWLNKCLTTFLQNIFSWQEGSDLEEQIREKEKYFQGTQKLMWGNTNIFVKEHVSSSLNIPTLTRVSWSSCYFEQLDQQLNFESNGKIIF